MNHSNFGNLIEKIIDKNKFQDKAKDVHAWTLRYLRRVNSKQIK